MGQTARAAGAVTFQPDCFRPSLTRRLRPAQGRGPAGSGAADRHLDRDRRRALRRHGDGHQPHRAAGHRQPPGARHAALGAQVPLRPPADGAAGVGPPAGQAVRRAWSCRTGWNGSTGWASTRWSSSPDPYFCRPMTLQEIDVDAISCPTQHVQQREGPLLRSRPPTPSPPHVQPGRQRPRPTCRRPRATTRPATICAPSSTTTATGNAGPMCATSARQYAEHQRPGQRGGRHAGLRRSRSTAVWRVPDELADGDYAVLVEVSKEFDRNASHSYPAAAGSDAARVGHPHELRAALGGVPGAVQAGPRRRPISRPPSQIAGYGDWDGQAPAPCTRPTAPSATRPGSGVGRLLSITQPAAGGGLVAGTGARGDRGAGRRRCPNRPQRRRTADVDGGAPDAGRSAMHQHRRLSTLRHAGLCPIRLAAAIAVMSAEGPGRGGRGDASSSRRAPPGSGSRATSCALERHRSSGRAAFASGTAAARDGQEHRPGATVTVPLANLKSREPVHRGRARRGASAWRRSTAFASFTTRIREFTQLSGCFIATAAYGSPLASGRPGPAPDARRRARAQPAGGGRRRRLCPLQPAAGRRPPHLRGGAGRGPHAAGAAGLRW